MNSIIRPFVQSLPPPVKFFADPYHLLLVAVALVSGGLLFWPMIQRGTRSGSVSTSEAVRLINRERGVLIDIGEPAEFAAGHAAGARNVPLGELDGAKALPSNKALPLVVLCPTGSRSARAVAQLRKAGYDKAVPLAGGTAAWREASLPIERAN